MYLININENILNCSIKNDLIKIANKNLQILDEFEQEQTSFESVIPMDNFIVRVFRAASRILKLYGTGKISHDLSILMKAEIEKIQPGEAQTKLSAADINLFLDKVVNFKLKDSELKEIKDNINIIKSTIDNLPSKIMYFITNFLATDDKYTNNRHVASTPTYNGMSNSMYVDNACGISITIILNILFAKSIINKLNKDDKVVEVIKLALKTLAKVINRLVGLSGDKFTEETIKALKDQTYLLPKGGKNSISESDKKKIVEKLTKISKDHVEIQVNTTYNLLQKETIEILSKDALKIDKQIDSYIVDQLDILSRLIPEYINYTDNLARLSKVVYNDIRKF